MTFSLFSQMCGLEKRWDPYTFSNTICFYDQRNFGIKVFPYFWSKGACIVFFDNLLCVSSFFYQQSQFMKRAQNKFWTTTQSFLYQCSLLWEMLHFIFHHFALCCTLSTNNLNSITIVYRAKCLRKTMLIHYTTCQIFFMKGIQYSHNCLLFFSHCSKLVMLVLPLGKHLCQSSFLYWPSPFDNLHKPNFSFAIILDGWGVTFQFDL